MPLDTSLVVCLLAGGGFSHSQVDALLSAVSEDAARPGRRVLLVLHSRWFDERTDKKPVKRKAGKRHKPTAGSVDAVPTSEDDSAATSRPPVCAVLEASHAPGSDSRKRSRSVDEAPVANPLCAKWQATDSVYLVPKGAHLCAVAVT